VKETAPEATPLIRRGVRPVANDDSPSLSTNSLRDIIAIYTMVMRSLYLQATPWTATYQVKPNKALSLSLTLKRRCTYRPSVIYSIVNKLLSLSLSLSLPVSLSRAHARMYGLIYANSEFRDYGPGTVTPHRHSFVCERESLSTGASRVHHSSCYYFRSPIESGACLTPKSDWIAKLQVRMRLPHPGTPVCVCVWGGGGVGGGEIRDLRVCLCGGGGVRRLSRRR
jgi:hypothetical protein